MFQQKRRTRRPELVWWLRRNLLSLCFSKGGASCRFWLARGVSRTGRYRDGACKGDDREDSLKGRGGPSREARRDGGTVIGRWERRGAKRRGREKQPSWHGLSYKRQQPCSNAEIIRPPGSACGWTLATVTIFDCIPSTLPEYKIILGVWMEIPRLTILCVDRIRLCGSAGGRKDIAEKTGWESLQASGVFDGLFTERVKAVLK